ncbi:hypothetical protein Tco_0231333, partial [Tanacetum coccineum]
MAGLICIGMQFVLLEPTNALGKENSVVDALSRQREPIACHAITSTTIQNWDDLMTDLSWDVELTLLKKHVLNNEQGLDGYTFHNSVVGGHGGVLKHINGWQLKRAIREQEDVLLLTEGLTEDMEVLLQLEEVQQEIA